MRNNTEFAILLSIIALLGACAEKGPSNWQECLQVAMKKESAEAITKAKEVCKDLFPDEAEEAKKPPAAPSNLEDCLDFAMRKESAEAIVVAKRFCKERFSKKSEEPQEAAKLMGPEAWHKKYVKGSAARCLEIRIEEDLSIKEGPLCAGGARFEEISEGTFTLTCYDANKLARVYDLILKPTRMEAGPRQEGAGTLLFYHTLSACEDSISDSEREAYRKELAEEMETRWQKEEQKQRKLLEANKRCCHCLAGSDGKNKSFLDYGEEYCVRRMKDGLKPSGFSSGLPDYVDAHCGEACLGSAMGD